MLEEILRSGFEAYSLPLDERALERYRLYADALEETNKVMNLTAIEGEDETARLHFLDSAALLTLADFGGKRGEIRTLEIVPAGAPTALQVTYPVDADTEFTFVAEWTDSEGTHIVRALPVAVEISANGVVPQGEVREARRLFSGESVQMDQSSIYLYLIFGGCVILAGLILALWITSRKERRARRERQALQRQRKREDLEKTNRFVPVKRPAPRKERRERQEEPPRGGTE